MEQDPVDTPVKERVVVQCRASSGVIMTTHNWECNEGRRLQRNDTPSKHAKSQSREEPVHPNNVQEKGSVRLGAMQDDGAPCIPTPSASDCTLAGPARGSSMAGQGRKTGRKRGNWVTECCERGGHSKRCHTNVSKLGAEGHSCTRGARSAIWKWNRSGNRHEVRGNLQAQG